MFSVTDMIDNSSGRRSHRQSLMKLSLDAVIAVEMSVRCLFSSFLTWTIKLCSTLIEWGGSWKV